MSTTSLETFLFPSNNIDERLANVAINHIDQPVMITDNENKIIYINKKFEQTTGYTFSEIQGKTPKALQSGIQKFSFYEQMKKTVIKTGQWQGELWNRSKDGKVYLQSLSIIALKNKEGSIENFVGIFSNLFKDKMEDSQVQSLEAYYDSLTDLPTRIIFEKRALTSLKHAEQHKKHFAIFFFKLENFKHIRDQYGTLYSDVLLKRVAARLMKGLPGKNLITRWNKVDFAGILEDIKSKAQIENFIENLHEKITSPITVNGVENHLQVSIGVSIYKMNGKTISELLANAHTAMKKAKAEQSIYRFSNQDLANPSNFFILEFELERAIEQAQFELYYQPLIDVATKKIKGFEALVRWNHPTAGVISPLKFIPLAEQTGLIHDLGYLVFKQACDQLSDWRRKGYTDIKINVNLSMNQFKGRNLVDNIDRTLAEAQVPPEQIVIELTESSLSENKEETITTLHQLKTLGLSIALDDFGTGYSSLGYIIDFPVDKLKIDRSFIRVIEDNKKIEAIISAINAMAKTMDISVVAEGVETEAQFNIIEELACDTVQGYLFDKPLPRAEAEAKWLE